MELILERYIGHMIEALSRWNRWGSARLEPGLRRDVLAHIAPFLDTPEVLALIGPRRAGKTTVLFQVMETLASTGIPDQAMLHVNLEEPSFAPRMDHDLLERLYRAYRESVYPDGRAYVFLDEVQHVPEWERWVRARKETEDIKVFVTGSSSALLSAELGSLLTGRHVTFRVMPLTFREFLRFRDIPVPHDPTWEPTPPKVQQAMSRYLRWGGFPEVVLADNDQRKDALLKQYFEDVLYKDVALRHEVRDLATLRSLAVHLVTQTASLTSFQRLAKLFGSSLDLVRSYCQYLQEAFLVHVLPFHSLKVGERRRRPSKIHAVDTGLRNAISFGGTPDFGRVAESAVVQAMRHHHNDTDLFYWSGKQEVDVVVRRGTHVSELIQVLFEGSDETGILERELRALEEAKWRFRKAKRLLVVGRFPPGQSISAPGVQVVPLWRSLLA